MPSLTDTFRRVPKWALYTSAGVAIAGVGMYVVRNRAGADEDTSTTGDSSAVTGYPDFSGPSPVPGIVVPDVNIGGGEPSQGIGDLHDTYIQGLQMILDTLINRPVIEPSPSVPVPIQITLDGGAGGAASEPVPGVVTAAPPASQQPAPTHPCKWNGQCLSWWRNANHNRRDGKWRWPDGSGFVHSRAFEGHARCDSGTAGVHC